jgi:tripartite-type tricarboxylate transporter receptor subunit TctC
MAPSPIPSRAAPDPGGIASGGRRRLIAGAGGALALAGAPRAFAQQGPMKLLVGFPAGGLPDQVARALAEHYRVALGTTVLVENRVGAVGRLAANGVKNAPPDGMTLLVTPGLGITHLPHVFTDLGFDAFTDFTPIGGTVESDFAIAIDPALPVKTLREFADWCRANPARAAYGTAGEGSAPHLMGFQLAQALGVPMQHIPYKGANFAATDVMGGHLASVWATTPFLLPHHAAGKLRIVATTGKARAAKLPDVPTFAELGMPQLTMIDGNWVFAHAKTPPAIVERLAAATAASVGSKEMQALIASQNVVPAPLSPSALAQVMREQHARQGAAVRAAGFRPQ